MGEKHPHAHAPPAPSPGPWVPSSLVPGPRYRYCATSTYSPIRLLVRCSFSIFAHPSGLCSTPRPPRPASPSQPPPTGPVRQVVPPWLLDLLLERSNESPPRLLRTMSAAAPALPALRQQRPRQNATLSLEHRRRDVPNRRSTHFKQNADAVDSKQPLMTLGRWPAEAKQGLRCHRPQARSTAVSQALQHSHVLRLRRVPAGRRRPLDVRFCYCCSPGRCAH